MGLGAGLTDLCKMMILPPEDPDYSETLSLLYDISSRIKVDPLLAQLLGSSGDTLKDIIDSIAEDPSNPTGLAGKILIILPLVINPLLGKSTFFLFCSHPRTFCLFSESSAIPPMISLKEGTFGFFKGTNATKSWWKINNGQYNLDEYQKVLEFNGNSRY